MAILKKVFISLLFFSYLSFIPAYAQNKKNDSPDYLNRKPPSYATNSAIITNLTMPSQTVTNIAQITTNTTNTSNTNNSEANTNEGFISDVNTSEADSSKNMIFDSYDEVIINNYEKQDLTHIKFIGNVKIRFDGNMLKARTVVITSKGNKVLDISAFEKVEFNYGGNTYLADFLSFNPDTKKGILKNVRSFLGNGMGGGTGNPFSSGAGTYYKAKKVIILESDKIIMEDVYFTFTPAEYPEYNFFSQRLWYYKGDLIYALFDSYTVGQANFIWFPFFMKWDKFTGLRTAFGREKRIGWYLMNSMGLTYDYGSFDLGLDIYERLGQYFTLTFKNRKPLGVFNSLSVFFEGANDNRVTYDYASDRYSQLVNVNGYFTNISQVSWHYILNAGISRNDMTMSFKWEDLNDPFFVTKYQQRRYDFDIKEVIQPDQNSFFNNRDYATPYVSGFSRSLTLNYKNFGLSGNWNYTRTENPEISNKYLNDYYRYYLSSVQFPNMTFRLDTIDLINDMNYSYPVTKTITLSNTNITVGVNDNIDSYVNQKVMTISNITNAIGSDGDSNGTPQIVTRTNFQIAPLTYGLATNDYKLWSISSYINANGAYSSYESLDTNGKPLSDNYRHDETVTFNLNGSFLNGLIGQGNTLTFVNRKIWSTLSNEQANNIAASGNQLDLSSSASIGGTPVLFPGNFWQISFPLSLSQSLGYQVFTTFPTTAPKTISLGTSAGSGISLLDGNLALGLSASLSMNYRLTNYAEDVYIDNLLERSLSSSASLKIYWLTFGTGIRLNLLETKTNYITYTYTCFTNRIYPGYNPMLSVGFHPPAEYLPMPSIDYTYDIINQTNVSISASTSYSLSKLYNFIFYEIETLNFSSSLNWNFLSPRSTTFSFTFSTAIWFNPTWQLTFSTSVLNNRIYRYSKENAIRFNEAYVEFWGNLKDSLNIFDYEGLKRGFFKIQSFDFGLVHYLNEWEMRLSFKLARRLDNLRMIAYWEPSLRIEFMLSGTQDQFPPYEKKFVPEQYQ